MIQHVIRGCMSVLVMNYKVTEGATHWFPSDYTFSLPGGDDG